MKVIIGIIIILASTVSCNIPGYSSKATLEVTNQTDEVIDSLLVQPDRQKYRYISLGPNKTARVTVDLSGLGDGAYGVTYKMGDKHKSMAFGYF